MKRFYLTTQATQISWNYVGDPKNPNTTMDVGIITVEDKSEIRVDDFGMYVERDLIANKSSMDIKDTKEFERSICKGFIGSEREQKFFTDWIIQDRTKLIEEVIQWHKERYSKNILNEKQHGQAYWNAKNENDGWNSATQDTIETLTKLK